MTDRPLIQRVKQRIREHGQNYKINELCMDQLPIVQITPQISKVLEKCLNVQYITLERCKLVSLQNLPRLPKLEILQLGQNQIKGQSLKCLSKYPTLRELNLRNNKIQSMAELKQLEGLKQLTKLLLEGNTVCRQNFRSQIFALIPHLQAVDGYDRFGKVVHQESSSSGVSSVSDQQGEESEGELQKESPTKIKKKN